MWNREMDSGWNPTSWPCWEVSFRLVDHQWEKGSPLASNLLLHSQSKIWWWWGSSIDSRNEEGTTPRSWSLERTTRSDDHRRRSKDSLTLTVQFSSLQIFWYIFLCLHILLIKSETKIHCQWLAYALETAMAVGEFGFGSFGTIVDSPEGCLFL